MVVASYVVYMQGLVGNCGKAAPPGGVTRPLLFILNWAHIQQRNYKITENAQHNSVNNNSFNIPNCATIIVNSVENLHNKIIENAQHNSVNNNVLTV